MFLSDEDVITNCYNETSPTYHLWLFLSTRDDVDWKAEPCSPIDYCYVRPQHIPSVNTLCRDFFWPGIDREYRQLWIINYLFLGGGGGARWWAVQFSRMSANNGINVTIVNGSVIVHAATASMDMSNSYYINTFILSGMWVDMGERIDGKQDEPESVIEIAKNSQQINMCFSDFVIMCFKNFLVVLITCSVWVYFQCLNVSSILISAVLFYTGEFNCLLIYPLGTW